MVDLDSQCLVATECLPRKIDMGVPNNGPLDDDFSFQLGDSWVPYDNFQGCRP